jgi:hypothetical protein
MFSLPVENWWRLIGWLLLGLAIYFLYGRKHSVMEKERHMAHELSAHGLSPHAVGDPDAPPSSPAAPVDSRVKKG